MIKPQELRIGKFIYDDENQIVKVEKIESQYFNQENEPGAPLVIFSKHGHGLWESDVINPIPLTEELLLKCGFKRGSVTMYFLSIPNLACEIHATWFHNQYVIELQNNRIPIVTEVTYFHQLQNLYFALTGKELEIKF